MTREEYQARKLSGVCTRWACAEMAKDGASLCKEHAAYQTESDRRYAKRHRRKRKAQKRRAHKARVAWLLAHGRCRTCGEKNDGLFENCEPCLEYKRGGKPRKLKPRQIPAPAINAYATARIAWES